MKIAPLIIGVFISLSGAKPAQEKHSISTQNLFNFPIARNNPPTGKWTENFLELQKAISRGDKNTIKSFIDFPIKNKGNEIWYLANSKLVMEIDPGEIKPFTESDIDKYFSSIFALDLRMTFEKLDAEEFFKTNKGTSPEIEVVKDSKSKLVASFDSKNQKITLALVTTFTNQGNSTFTIFYGFDVLNSQQIKFLQIHME